MTRRPAASSLFADELSGFAYADGFISAAEESSLLAHISQLTFANFEMRGVVARRRVAFFGKSYRSDAPAAAIPTFLFDVRERLAKWAAVPADDFAMALINEYTPGAPIGWHRDAPQYDVVAGVSLGAPCRMRFRPYLPPSPAAGGRSRRRATHEFTLAPRSAYLLTADARDAFEHSIPPVAQLRYSLTFRTLRRRDSEPLSHD